MKHQKTTKTKQEQKQKNVFSFFYTGIILAKSTVFFRYRNSLGRYFSLIFQKGVKNSIINHL